MNYQDIITIEPGKRGGKPCIRGMKITVYDGLEYMASGMSQEEVLKEFPYLTEDDIRACLAYADDARRARRPAGLVTDELQHRPHRHRRVEREEEAARRAGSGRRHGGALSEHDTFIQNAQ